MATPRFVSDASRTFVTPRGGGMALFEAVSADKSPAEFAVAPEGWTHFSDALIAADFWSLNPVDEFGLDGARWLIQGKVYRGISRWSPQGEASRAGSGVLRPLPGRPCRGSGLSIPGPGTGSRIRPLRFFAGVTSLRHTP